MTWVWEDPDVIELVKAVLALRESEWASLDDWDRLNAAIAAFPIPEEEA